MDILHSMSKKENFFPPWEKSNIVNANYNATKTPSLVYVVVLEIKTHLPVCRKSSNASFISIIKE